MLNAAAKISRNGHPALIRTDMPKARLLSDLTAQDGEMNSRKLWPLRSGGSYGYSLPPFWWERRGPSPWPRILPLRYICWLRERADLLREKRARGFRWGGGMSLELWPVNLIIWRIVSWKWMR